MKYYFYYRPKQKKVPMKKFDVLILLNALTIPLAIFSDCQSIDTSCEAVPCIPAIAQVITTPTNPVVRCQANFFFSTEYLLMTATEGGLSYARDNFPLQSFSDQQNRECYEVNFDWNSGFRLGIGYNMGHDRWDTQVLWTWMRNQGNGHHSDTNNQLFATNAMPGVSAESGIMADRFETHMTIQLNLLDWQLGREFFLSKWLKVRPFTGLRTGWVNQDWKTKGTGNVIAMNNDLTAYIVKMEQEFWGIGPMIGFNSEWGVISRLSLYANGSLTLLSGFFKDHRNDQGLQASPSAVINNPFSKHTHCGQSITELQLGLRWNQWCSHERYRFSLQAGWDVILLSDHNHLFAINGQSQSLGTSYGQTQHLQEMKGNLMFQGLSFGCRLDF